MKYSPFRAIVADLGKKTVEFAAPCDSAEKGMRELKEKYPDAVVLCAGAFTGTLVQASSVVVAQCAGKKCLLRGQTGPGLRRLGAHALVLTGASDEACGLVIGKEKGLFFSCGAKTDVPSLRAQFEKQSSAIQGWFEPAMLLAGPAAFSGAPAAAVSLNVGMAPRTGWLAQEMARRNLAGIALAGGTPVLSPLPVDHPLCSMVKADAVRSASLPALLKAACPEAKTGALPKPLRPIACFGCPSPCGFWMAGAAGDPVPCTSPEGLALLSAAGADAARIALVFAFADAWGLDPAGLTSLASGPMPESLEAWDAQSALPLDDKEPLPVADASAEAGVCPFFLARSRDFAGALDKFLAE